ncbi:MAG: energy transducer TonB [Bryobacterales bacterium]|nr:energy transducer TonB [Bryobacterales bacterium]
MLEGFQRYWHADQEEPQFLLDLAGPEARSRYRTRALGAVGYHIALLVFALNAPSSAVRYSDAPRVMVDIRRATPLIAPRDVPPFQVTQKEPQRSKPAAEVDLASLMPKPEIRQTPMTPAGKPFQPPAAPAVPPSPRPAPVIEAPRIEMAQQAVPDVSNAPKLPNLPPPPEQPKASPFERPSSGMGVRGPGQTAGAAPKLSVDDALRAAARGGAGRGVVVGDVGAGGAGGISEGILQSASPQKTASSLELLSDPQGVDFRPYLVQVLASVKRNWQSVFPESARLGRQGRVAIQFSIDKSGSVPKLVIANPSGAEALDRAAVAGISMSNPFPPLPNEFRGREIRVQLMFSYNLPR